MTSVVQYPLSSPFSLFVAIDQDPVIACIEVETRFGDHLLQQKHAVPLEGANAFAGETGPCCLRSQRSSSFRGCQANCTSARGLWRGPNRLQPAPPLWACPTWLLKRSPPYHTDPVENSTSSLAACAPISSMALLTFPASLALRRLSGDCDIDIQSWRCCPSGPRPSMTLACRTFCKVA